MYTNYVVFKNARIRLIVAKFASYRRASAKNLATIFVVRVITFFLSNDNIALHNLMLHILKFVC